MCNKYFTHDAKVLFLIRLHYSKMFIIITFVIIFPIWNSYSYHFIPFYLCLCCVQNIVDKDLDALISRIYFIQKRKPATYYFPFFIQLRLIVLRLMTVPLNFLLLTIFLVTKIACSIVNGIYVQTFFRCDFMCLANVRFNFYFIL